MTNRIFLLGCFAVVCFIIAAPNTAFAQATNNPDKPQTAPNRPVEESAEANPKEQPPTVQAEPKVEPKASKPGKSIANAVLGIKNSNPDEINTNEFKKFGTEDAEYLNQISWNMLSAEVFFANGLYSNSLDMFDNNLEKYNNIYSETQKDDALKKDMFLHYPSQMVRFEMNQKILKTVANGEEPAKEALKREKERLETQSKMLVAYHRLTQSLAQIQIYLQSGQFPEAEKLFKEIYDPETRKLKYQSLFDESTDDFVILLEPELTTGQFPDQAAIDKAIELKRTCPGKIVGRVLVSSINDLMAVSRFQNAMQTNDYKQSMPLLEKAFEYAQNNTKVSFTDVTDDSADPKIMKADEIGAGSGPILDSLEKTTHGMANYLCGLCKMNMMIAGSPVEKADILRYFDASKQSFNIALKGVSGSSDANSQSKIASKIDLYTQSLKSPDGFIRKAALATNQGNTEDALKMILYGLRFHPKSPELYVELLNASRRTNIPMDDKIELLTRARDVLDESQGQQLIALAMAETHIMDLILSNNTNRYEAEIPAMFEKLNVAETIEKIEQLRNSEQTPSKEKVDLSSIAAMFDYYSYISGQNSGEKLKAMIDKSSAALVYYKPNKSNKDNPNKQFTENLLDRELIVMALRAYSSATLDISNENNDRVIEAFRGVYGQMCINNLLSTFPYNTSFYISMGDPMLISLKNQNVTVEKIDKSVGFIREENARLENKYLLHLKNATSIFFRDSNDIVLSALNSLDSGAQSKDFFASLSERQFYSLFELHDSNKAKEMDAAFTALAHIRLGDPCSACKTILSYVLGSPVSVNDQNPDNKQFNEAVEECFKKRPDLSPLTNFTLAQSLRAFNNTIKLGDRSEYRDRLLLWVSEFYLASRNGINKLNASGADKNNKNDYRFLSGLVDASIKVLKDDSYLEGQIDQLSQKTPNPRILRDKAEEYLKVRPHSMAIWKTYLDNTLVLLARSDADNNNIQEGFIELIKVLQKENTVQDPYSRSINAFRMAFYMGQYYELKKDAHNAIDSYSEAISHARNAIAQANQSNSKEVRIAQTELNRASARKFRVVAELKSLSASDKLVSGSTY